MTAYHPEEWHEFFVMMGHGSAVLAGLVFVAMELNAALLFKDEAHRGRAFGTISGFMVILALCAFGLMGYQTNVSLGVAWLITATVGLGIFVHGFVQQPLGSRQGQFGVTPLRTAMGVLSHAGLIIGAGLFIAGQEIGIYISAVFMVLTTVYLVSGAWLLIRDVTFHSKKKSRT